MKFNFGFNLFVILVIVYAYEYHYEIAIYAIYEKFSDVPAFYIGDTGRGRECPKNVQLDLPHISIAVLCSDMTSKCFYKKRRANIKNPLAMLLNHYQHTYA
jgi:hypothetical protein